MSHCRECNTNDDHERDYWFRTEQGCHDRLRDSNIRPIFPSIIRANIIIPQTTIPISIVISPDSTTTLVGSAGIPSVLQTTSGLPQTAVNTLGLPQTVVVGTTNPLNTNLVTENGIISGF
jgi:hypothetical protein